MTTFALGEIAVLRNATYFEEWEGCLAVITGPLIHRYPRNMHTMECDIALTYKVMPLVEGAIEVNCEPHQLRKLDDPGVAESETVHEENEVPETVTV